MNVKAGRELCCVIVVGGMKVLKMASSRISASLSGCIKSFRFRLNIKVAPRLHTLLLSLLQLKLLQNNLKFKMYLGAGDDAVICS